MKEIRNILKAYDQFKVAGLKMALASVIRIEESSYRRVGARLLVCENGQWSGGISGGCLEGDALKRAQIAIFKNSSSCVSYNTLEDDQNQIGVGLGCNGLIDVLFTPIDVDDAMNEIEQLRIIEEKNEPAILLKVIESLNADHEAGICKYIFTDTQEYNFIDIPEAILDEAIKQVRIKRRPHILPIDLAPQGKYRLLVEYIKPETRLVIIGDNYDVLALTGIVQEMGWEIHLVGRKRKIFKSLAERAKVIYEYEDFDKVPINSYTAVTLMTHDYDKDLMLIPQILKKQPAYFGILGPKKRRIKLQSDLPGISSEAFHSIHAPIGFDIGAETPEEIAVSIITEILAVFRNRNGQFLKNREGTIHERIHFD